MYLLSDMQVSNTFVQSVTREFKSSEGNSLLIDNAYQISI